MKRLHITLLIIVSTIVLALPAVFELRGAIAAAPVSRQSSCGSWSVVPVPAQSPSQFTGVATISSNNAWAVGFTGTSYQPTGTLIEHWDGTRWSMVASPDPKPGMGYQLNGIAAVSTNDVWAVGEYQNHGLKTLIIHWDGTQWSVIASPTAPGQPVLTGVTAIAKNDVWAVGYDGQPLTEHWNGTQWSIIATPTITGGDGRLYSVGGAATSNVWAVGIYITDPGYNKLTLLFHWNGKKWKRVTIPVNYDSSLGGVAAKSTKNVWAVGFENSETLNEHWNGTGWQQVASPSVGALNAVTAVPGSKMFWAVGYAQLNGYTLAELWDGTRWNVVSTPTTGFLSSNFLGVSASDASHVWAVGNYVTSSNETYPLAEFYC